MTLFQFASAVLCVLIVVAIVRDANRPWRK